MAANQGYIRLLKGYEKVLNKSEISRGWLYITKDKKALGLLSPHLTLVFEGNEYKLTIDLSGRILTGRVFNASLPPRFHIQYIDGLLTITK